MKSEEFYSITEYLSSNVYPAHICQENSRHKKKNFRQKASKYLMGEGEKLFKGMIEVLRSNDLDEVLKLYHDKAAHPGINATTLSIKEKYFWPGLNKDVREHVNSCHICQITSAVKAEPQRKLNPIPPPLIPWNHVGIDLVCDLQDNADGYKHMLVTTCYLSKFIAARPLKTKTSKEVLTQLQKIYLTLGVPSLIRHDQGREFVSKEFHEFHMHLGVECRKSAPYHPQTNGLVEAHNRILKTKLGKMVLESGEEWPSKLQAAVLAANTCWKKSTEFSPFFLMFGRRANGVHLLEHYSVAPKEESDSEFDNQISEDDGYSPNIPLTNSDIWAEQLVDNHSMSRDLAHDNILREQLLQKTAYDCKVQKNRSDINEGDKILVRNMPKAKKMPGTKSQPKYLGPMVVAKATDTHVFVFNNNSEDIIKKFPVHLCRPYFPRSEGEKKSKRQASQPTQKKSKKMKIDNKKFKPAETGTKWIFGITKESIIRVLDEFKLLFSNFVTSGVHISKLHKELEDESNKGFYVPEIILYQVLKDSDPETMRRVILFSLMEWTTDLFKEWGASRMRNYADKVLYAVAMEYIEKKLCTPELDLQEFQHLTVSDPVITLISVEWQKEKSALLGLTYLEPTDQHPTMAGQKLREYEPWTCYDIVADGNCLFRCLSKIICGSEDYHEKVRGEITRYMVSDGKEVISWYFDQVMTTTPAAHLCSKFMYQLGKWGTDAELMAASAILQTDIYLANNFYRTNEVVSEVRWSRLRPSNANSNNFAIYISNFYSHFQPVSQMINSITPTFFPDETDPIDLR